MQDNPMTMIEHLKDLRKTLIISLTTWCILTVVTFFGFQDQIFDFLSLHIKAMELKLVILSPLEGFMVKLKSSFFAGLLFSLPVILWEVWRFILPALNSYEKKYMLVIFPSSLVLFLAGVGFSYCLVLGVALKFLVMTAGEGFIPMLGAAKYLGFVISLLLPFGIIFQLPLITLFLTYIGLITPKIMAAKRRYAIIVIFVMAAVFTPSPDILTQTIMAFPMIILYEISILISRLVLRKKVCKNMQLE